MEVVFLEVPQTPGCYQTCFMDEVAKWNSGCSLYQWKNTQHSGISVLLQLLYRKCTFITPWKIADGVLILFEICTIFILTNSHVGIACKVYNKSKFCSIAFGYVIKKDTLCVVYPGEECYSIMLTMYIVNDEKVVIPHHCVY